MSLENAAALAMGVLLWHVVSLNSLIMVSGMHAKTRFFAPRSVLLSQYHLAGVLCAVLAVISVLLGAMMGFVGWGFIIGALFAAADTFFIYRAVKSV